MDFSEEWKSPWTISSVYDPPLLISNPSSSTSLGPLLFSPSPKTLHLLYSSSSLSSPFSLPPFPFRRPKLHKPPPPQDSTDSQSHPHGEIPTFNNTLQFLRCSKHDFLLFFPSGDGLGRVGFAKVSVRGSKLEILNEEEDISVTEDGFESRVRRIEVSSVVVDGIWDFSAESGNSVVIGFLLACSIDSVYWYSVEIGNTPSDIGKPVLAYLGTSKFSVAITHACWNSHLPEESLVLLENGDLFLFDMESCTKAEKFPVMLEGDRINVTWDSMEESRWLSCGFSWHPRIIVVACSSTVYLVDWRFKESNVSVLAKVEMFHLNRTVKDSQFVAFCKAGSDGFYFAVATEENLFLIDIRKPMMSVLQWAHGLDNPHYIDVFRLSELRSRVKDAGYKWASDSGFAILLGSFLNCKFSLFCYGPPLPAPDESVASDVSKFCNSLYAWDLPSEISVLGRQCNSGDCLLEQEFSNAALPEWKKERILGLCVIAEGLLADQQTESVGLSGFTLIRLVSSGKLESQRYSASCNFTSLKLERSREKSLHVEYPFLDLFIDQKYKFPRRFRYLHLDSLLGFLNDDLPKVLMSKMKKTCPANKTTQYTQQNCERICDILKSAGIDSIGFCPTIETLLKEISWPMNIHEITSSRMWGGLNVDLLQLAFTINAELIGVLIEHRKISLEALDIPMLPQLPPFFSKTPTSRSSTWSWKLQLDDILVGPVLPLPYLLALPKVKREKNCFILEEEESEEDELTRQCNKVMTTATKVASSGYDSQLNDSPVVSLANDKDETWVASEELKPIFFHKPSAFLEAVDTTPRRPVYQDEKFDTFISKTVEKESTSSPVKEVVGLNAFDDMCPIALNFDYPYMKFGVKEGKGYKLLKRQFSKWQKGKMHYQDFCKALKIQKRVP